MEKFVYVSFSEDQIKALEHLLNSAIESCDDNDSRFRGFIETGLKEIINEKSSLFIRD